MNERTLMKVLMFAVATLLPGAIAAGPETMDARLDAFFREYLEAQFRLQPTSATQLGEHRFDHLLEDVSAKSRGQWLELDLAALRELPKRVEYAALSRQGQIDYEILEQQLKRSIWATENIRRFERDPRVYNEYISDSVYLLLSQSTLPQTINVSNAVARMQQIPGIVAAAKQNLGNPPKQYVETAIRQNDGSIRFYQKDVFVLAGRTEHSGALRSEADKVVRCLEDYRTFLQTELLPRSNGEWRLGPEQFNQKLELELNAGISAGQVLADAEAEYQRVRGEMYVIARQRWHGYFKDEALPADTAEGRQETIARVLAEIGKNHSQPKRLVSEVRQTVGQLKDFIRSRDILRLPEPDTCQIIEMPEFQRGNATAYMNSPPPLDAKAKGFYAVSPPPQDWDAARVKSFFEEYNRSMLRILTIHEAYPGHYVQFEYANRVPSLIRRVLPSGVYVEGWAVYTEQTLLDQGYGEGDLDLRLTQLKFYLRAVVNAILDHKMHCAGMTDEEALQLLTRGAFQAEGEARLKVVRSKQSSVQLSTYFVGRMAHYRLRQEIQTELGQQFKLGRYHEAVLSQGAVPPKFLGELVRARIARQL